MASVYDYSFHTLDGREINLSDYKGKKLLIVNTASECGYTPQYEQLEELYKHYSDRLEVIGFPSNQFGGQEPGSNEEIATFCQKNYGVSFPIAEKTDVKGEEAHPLFNWLTDSGLNGIIDYKIKWNFTKFLVNEEGRLAHIFNSATEPYDEEVIKAIEGEYGN